LKGNHFILFVLAMALLSACNNRPSYVLSDKKMENILFDLYIAETEIKENNPVFLNDSLRKQQLLHSVFGKHRLSEQTFDTSLVWYNANLEKYLKIIEKVTKRYASSIEDLRKERERLIAKLTVRDTAFLYTSSAFTLQSAGRENIHAFKADTSHLNALKKYTVEFLTLGIRDSVSSPVFTFCIQCEDTTFVYRDTLIHSGPFSKQYTFLPKYAAKSVFGNLYLPPENKNPLLVGYFAVYQQKTTLPSPETLHSETFQIR
jgi:hypothetical protein